MFDCSAQSHSLFIISTPGCKYYLKSLKYCECLLQPACTARWVGFTVLGLFYWSIKPGELNQAQRLLKNDFKQYLKPGLIIRLLNAIQGQFSCCLTIDRHEQISFLEVILQGNLMASYSTTHTKSFHCHKKYNCNFISRTNEPQHSCVYTRNGTLFPIWCTPFDHVPQVKSGALYREYDAIWDGRRDVMKIHYSLIVYKSSANASV